jgi:hypothetical protein
MFQIDIDLDDAAGRERLGELLSRVEDREGLHEAMGERVSDAVRDHLVKRNSPKSGWWQRAGRSVSHTFSESGAVVRVAQRGVALRFYGGTVKRKPGGPLLAIPTDKVPVSGGTRKAPREMGVLAFLPSRSGGKGGHTVGYLVEGERYQVTRGRNKGRTATRPRFGPLAIYYILRSQTDHDPDPSVLPDGLEVTAREAAEDFLL